MARQRRHGVVDLPSDLEPALYYIEVTDADGNLFGDLIGMELPVAINRPHPGYEWALDDPAISLLPNQAIIKGPGFEVTVSSIRSGQLPDGAEAFMTDPPSDTQRVPILLTLALAVATISWWSLRRLWPRDNVA